ncbi:DEP domain-containing mTOR-interacting protein [Leptodactylus fuscus]|uniref:DEP domain-containing mTOR-interacting protein n=1 Tax=Leptodactylus fuscus TaxID=238119 RepID=UPI003F4EF6B4
MESLSLAVLKKAAEMEEIAEIHIICDQLKTRLQEDKIIKDRRIHLCTYPYSVVAREVIDWLIDRKEATDRAGAVELMNKVMEYNLLHHVSNQYPDFRDSKLLYRFAKDDGTFPMELDVKVIMRGQRIYEKITNANVNLLQSREVEGVKYERCFVAREMIDMLIHIRECKNRSHAEQLCRRLLEHAVIQHVLSKRHFSDSNHLFQFRLNFRRRRRLAELLNKRPQAVVDSQGSPFCLRKHSHDTASFSSMSSSSDGRVAGARRSSMSSGSSSAFHNNASGFTFSNPEELCNPRSVLKRPVTLEELLAPGAPYVRKTLTVVSDAVGWGFVVRGNKPCHIQAVDPTGPAASAGVKLRQFVVSVNGHYSLDCDYKTVSTFIITGPRTIVLEVMEEMNP